VFFYSQVSGMGRVGEFILVIVRVGN